MSGTDSPWRETANNKDGRGVITLPEVAVADVVSSDWGAGWCADVTVTNIGEGAALWTSRIPVDGTINTIWSAEFVVDGADWEFWGEPWNRALEPGEETEFGFCATR